MIYWGFLWQRIILTFLDEARSNIKEKRWVFRIWSLFDRKFVIISQYCLMLRKTPGSNIVSLNNVKVRKTVENIRQRFLTFSQSSVRAFIFRLKCGGKDAVRNLIALSVCLGVGYKLKQPFNIALPTRQLLQWQTFSVRLSSLCSWKKREFRVVNTAVFF